MARINSHLGRRGRLRLGAFSDIAALALSGSRAEHEGRVPQPGVAPGPRNSSTASGSAHYHSDLSIPGYQPKTPTVAPGPGEAATSPAGDYAGAQGEYNRAVASLPGPAYRATIAALAPPPLSRPDLGLALGKTLGAALTPASVLEALLGGLSGDGQSPVLASAPPQPPIDTFKPTGPTPKIRQAEIQSHKDFLRENGGRPAPVDLPKKGAPQLVSSPPPPAARDPRDPLGAKTLGDVSAGELVQAQRAGTLHINQAGILSTPENRQAQAQLLAARHRVAATNGLTGPFNPTQEKFILGVAHGTHLSPRTIGAQALGEEGGGPGSPAEGYEHEGEFNFLNVGPGQHYGTLPQAVKKTVDTYNNGNYGAVLATAGQSPQAQVNALEASPWAGVGGYQGHLQSLLPTVGFQHNPQAVAALQAAKQNAKAHGINPTPFNGDVAGGGAGFTVVRADAKGMLEWAESALGTQEGTPRAERWGSRFGLSTVTQPWCANFVGNGLLRRGITKLPGNPNYVPSYEEWAQEGHEASVVKGGLAAAKPGDLIAFSGQHIGIYAGGGEMISGNFGDEVSRDPISADSSPVSMVIRPHYKGGKVKVADAELAGSTSSSALGSVGGVSGASEAVAAPSAGGRAASIASPELVALQSPLSAGPTLPDAYLGSEDPHVDSAAQSLLALLGEEPSAPLAGRRPALS